MKTNQRNREMNDSKHGMGGNAMKKSMLAATAGILLAGPAFGGNIEVDQARSRIQVDAKATGHAFTGNLEQYKVRITGDVSSLAPTTCELKWTFDHLKTGDADRDKEMLKWLGGGQPEGSFTFSKFWDDAEGHHAMGTLKIHGVKQTLAFPYSVKREGDWVTIDGTAALNYTDFDLPLIRSMALMTVKPELNIRFHLVGKLP